MITRKHIILPKSLTVQLKNSDKEDVRLENVLCHLKIYFENGSYYNFSFIPTDSNGKIFLTKNDILENTQLKLFYSNSFPLDTSPVKFEFMILDKNFISSFTKSVDSFLSSELDSALNELRARGYTETQVESAIPIIIKKKEENQKLNTLLRKNNNQVLNYGQDKSKIIDHWTEVCDYSFELILQP